MTNNFIESNNRYGLDETLCYVCYYMSRLSQSQARFSFPCQDLSSELLTLLGQHSLSTVLSGMYAVQFVHLHVLTFLVPSCDVLYDFRFRFVFVHVCVVGIYVLLMVFDFTQTSLQHADVLIVKPQRYGSHQWNRNRLHIRNTCVNCNSYNYLYNDKLSHIFPLFRCKNRARL